MFTTTTALWLLAISFAACFGFVMGGIMRSGKSSDVEIKRKPRRRRSRILSGQNSEPHLVLISPAELRAVKRV